jgi:hypothetical protein
VISTQISLGSFCLTGDAGQSPSATELTL